MQKHLFLFLLWFLFCDYAHADIQLPKILSDGAIFQREQRNLLWGWAGEGETVKVSLDGKNIGTTKALNGEWKLSFKGLKAGGPHTLRIEGNNKIEIKNILFGDVWLASGQSNMETPIYRITEMFPSIMENANYPNIREFKIAKRMIFDKPADDFEAGHWNESVGTKISNHSSAAYFFAKKIHLEENVPVGIINASFGGSPIESWFKESELKDYPKFLKAIAPLKDKTHLAAIKVKDQKTQDAWLENLNTTDLGLKSTPPWTMEGITLKHWKKAILPGTFEENGISPMIGAIWFRKEVVLPETAEGKPGFLRLGVIIDADETYINGQKVGNITYRYPPRKYSIPEGILRKGKNTIVVRVTDKSKQGSFVTDKPYYIEVADKRYNLSGDWLYRIGTSVDKPLPAQYNAWNQPVGCYNGMLAPLHNVSLKGVLWYQGESNIGRAKQYRQLFPLLINHWRDLWSQEKLPFLFVQLPNLNRAPIQPTESALAELRDAQLHTLKTVKNTGMVVSIDVGEWNDVHPLDKKSIGERLATTAQGLVYQSKSIYSGPIYKSHKVSKNRVELTFDHIGSGLHAPSGKLTSFALAGTDGKFHWAEAKIKGNKVIVESAKIKSPKKIRYAWSDNPSASLYNNEGLPASPFEAEL